LRTPVTIDQILNSKVGHLNQHLKEKGGKKKKAHKFGAVATELDGHKFPSIKEANRYLTLRGYLRLGLIKDLRLQKRYKLNEGGNFKCTYVADFVYIDIESGLEMVEDAKGFKTREYQRKKKLMFKIHGITIKEV
jgi:hypothetical protein